MNRTYVRIPTHLSSTINGENYGKIRYNETAPESVGALAEGLTETPNEEVSAVKDSTKEEVLEGLANAQAEYESARFRQAAAIRFARAQGITNKAIGEQLGITEGAVRYIVKTLGDAR